MRIQSVMMILGPLLSTIIAASIKNKSPERCRWCCNLSRAQSPSKYSVKPMLRRKVGCQFAHVPWISHKDDIVCSTAARMSCHGTGTVFSNPVSKELARRLIYLIQIDCSVNFHMVRSSTGSLDPLETSRLSRSRVDRS